MAGFSSYDDLINEVTTNGKLLQWDFAKYHTATFEAAGVWHRLWADAGMPGAGGEPSGTPGDAFTNVDGSINFANQSPDQKHLLTFGAVSTLDCMLMVYDRLAGVGGLVGSSINSALTVNSSALPRYSGTSAVGVEVWLETTTAGTASTPVVAMNSYTNSAGTTTRSGAALTISPTPAIHSMYKLPVQAGDLGVRSVETLNVSTASTSWVFNVVLIKPLVYLPLTANLWNERDLVLQFSSMPRVFDGASLGLMVLPTATTAMNVWGCLRAGYG